MALGVGGDIPAVLQQPPGLTFAQTMVGRCELTVSQPVLLKVPMVSALEASM
jgi:hypothetical protein